MTAVVDKTAFNDALVLPYNLRISDFDVAMQDVYDFFADVNALLSGRGLRRLDDMLRPAAMSGMVSDMMTASLAKFSRSLVANGHFNGHPDLIVRGVYAGDKVAAGDQGIEIKSTRKAGGAVDTHGARRQWMGVFVYAVDTVTEPASARDPMRFTEVYLGLVEEADFRSNARGPLGTRTATLHAEGIRKLRQNWDYRLDPVATTHVKLSAPTPKTRKRRRRRDVFRRYWLSAGESMYEPGRVRDAIIEYLRFAAAAEPVEAIHGAVCARLGPVASSSVRSYLRLNTPRQFTRTSRGRYRLRESSAGEPAPGSPEPEPDFADDLARLYRADCFSWLADCPERSVHAVVTDPPYGLVEYTDKEMEKLRGGRGGVWRIPPSFDGHQRAALPRFTTLSQGDHAALRVFFLELSTRLRRVVVPGANILVASNPLLVHLVASAMAEGGLELRGYLSRLVMTMRGGDRPKNAHEEFSGVSVMPRSMWEPWVVLRAPLEGRVQDNLRRWGTGGFRRPSEDRPFGDVIESGPTPAAERRIAPHPSLKPQRFLRQVVRGSLPLGEGIVLDPFAGSGSTLAAATAVGYRSVGIERDEHYVAMAATAIPALASLDRQGRAAGSRKTAPRASARPSRGHAYSEDRP